MAALQFVRGTLAKWDMKRQQDTKVRSVAFVCPAERFIFWEDVRVEAYATHDTAYGVALTSKPTRLGTLHKMMQNCDIYRIRKPEKLRFRELIADAEPAADLRLAKFDQRTLREFWAFLDRKAPPRHVTTCRSNTAWPQGARSCSATSSRQTQCSQTRTLPCTNGQLR